MLIWTTLEAKIRPLHCPTPQTSPSGFGPKNQEPPASPFRLVHGHRTWTICLLWERSLATSCDETRLGHRLLDDRLASSSLQASYLLRVDSVSVPRYGQSDIGNPLLAGLLFSALISCPPIASTIDTFLCFGSPGALLLFCLYPIPLRARPFAFSLTMASTPPSSGFAVQRIAVSSSGHVVGSGGVHHCVGCVPLHPSILSFCYGLHPQSLLERVTYLILSELE